MSIGLNQNKAFMLSIHWFEAIEIANPSHDGLKPKLRGALASGNGTLVSSKLPPDLSRTDADNPWRTRISTLIHKRDRKASDGKEMLWLDAMAAAFKSAILATSVDPRVINYIVTLAEAVGERQFADGVLIPMLRAKFSAQVPYTVFRFRACHC